MTTKDNGNKTTRRDRLRLFQKGIQAHLLGFKTITIAGVPHKVTDIVTAIDSDIEASDTADQAHAAWLQTVALEKGSHASLDPVISGTKQFVRLQFGNTETAQSTLGDFGMTAAKKAKVTPETRVAAAAKAKATRALLHTAGSKQKAQTKAQAAQAASASAAAAPAAAPVAGSTATTPTK